MEACSKGLKLVIPMTILVITLLQLLDTTRYVVLKKNQLSTSNLKTIYLIVRDVVVPNVFTPNNDGKNDLYLAFFEDDMGDRIVLPEGRSILDCLDVWEVRIYNKWGALVFENSPVQPAWDGRIEGDTASDGAYYCVLSYQKRCRNGPLEIIEHDFSLMKELLLFIHKRTLEKEQQNFLQKQSMLI